MYNFHDNKFHHVINSYEINGPYMSLKATLSTDQWTVYGLSRIQTIPLTLNFQFFKRIV